MKNQWPILILICIIVTVLFLFNRSWNGDEQFALDDLLEEESQGVEFEIVKQKGEETPTQKESVMKKHPVQNLPQQRQVLAPQQKKRPESQVVKPSIPKAAPRTVKTDLSKVAFTIQVASFKDESKATKALNQIKAEGFPAYVTSRNLANKGIWYRVYVGKFSNRSEANQMISKVQSKYRDAFIIAPQF